MERGNSLLEEETTGRTRLENDGRGQNRNTNIIGHRAVGKRKKHKVSDAIHRGVWYNLRQSDSKKVEWLKPNAWAKLGICVRLSILSYFQSNSQALPTSVRLFLT